MVTLPAQRFGPIILGTPLASWLEELKQYQLLLEQILQFWFNKENREFAG